MRFASFNLRSAIKRHPYLAAFLALAVLVRAALPLVIERVIETTAAESLALSIEVDDIDLGLLRGLVVVDGLRLAPADAERDEDGRLHADDVVTGWDRLRLNVGWLSLLGGGLRLSNVQLVGPVVRVVRNKDESINLISLFTPPEDDSVEEPKEAEASEEAPEEAAEPLPVSIDRLEIHRGRLLFDDRTLPDDEPLVLEIGPLVVENFSWPLPSDGNDAGLALDLSLDGAVLTVRGTAGEVDGKMSISATVDAENLRMANVRGYAGSLGWVDLHGYVDVHVAYELVGSDVHNVKGSVTLKRFSVGLPDYDRVPLLIDSLVLADVDIDLVGRRASLGELRLDGGSLTADPRYGPLLPIIIGVEQDEAADAAVDEPLVDEPPVDDGAPWSLSLAKLAVADLSIRVLTESDPVVLTVALDASDIAAVGGDPFPVKLALSEGDGSLDVEGRVQIDPPAAALSLEWDGLDLARFATAVPFEEARMLRSGTSTGKLRVGAGLPAPGVDADIAASSDTASGDVVVSGRIALDGFDVDLNPTLAAKTSWRRIDAEFASIVVPAALGDDEAKNNAGPITIEVDKLIVDEPSFSMVIDGADADTTDSDESAVVPADDAADDAAGEVADEAPAPVTITIKGFELRDARVDIEERNVNTPFSGAITASQIKSSMLSWPDLNARELQASGVALGGGTWSIDGDIREAKGQLAIKLGQVPLVPVSALSDDAAGLTIRRGELSLDTSIQVDGDSLDTRNRVTAHDLDLSGKGAEERFTANFGLPLSVVIALLKDPGGDISLDLPLSVRRGEAKAGVTTAVAAVLRETILGAVTSPLKLVGSVGIFGGKVANFSLEPVSFAPGDSIVDPSSSSTLEALAATVASRPALVLELRSVVVEADVRRLKERALLAAFESDTPLGEGVPDVSWLERRRLHGYLQALRDSEEATLEGESDVLLTAVLAARPLPAAALAELGAERVSKLQSMFRADYGLAAEQMIERQEPYSDVADSGLPRVEFALAASRELAQ